MSLFERCRFIVEVLKQLQGTIEEESGEASGSQLELIERLKEMSLDSGGFKPRSRPPLPPSSSSSSASSGSGAPGGAAGGPGAPGTSASTALPRRGLPSAGRDSHDRCLEELEKERSLLLAELEKEEKEKDWYYAQLQDLTKRIDSLPLTENFTLQTDMSRRQLEFEARHIRSAMEEQLGSCQEMERRAQARVSRIQQIEKDILRLGARLQVEGAQGASDSSGLAGAQVEMVYSLLSMLGLHDKSDMWRTLHRHVGHHQDSCIAISSGRQRGRREIRVLHLLEQVRHYSGLGWQENHERASTGGQPPVKRSLQAVAELLQVDCEMFGLSSDHYSITLRRYAASSPTSPSEAWPISSISTCYPRQPLLRPRLPLRSLHWWLFVLPGDTWPAFSGTCRGGADVNSKKALREGSAACGGGGPAPSSSHTNTLAIIRPAVASWRVSLLPPPIGAQADPAWCSCLPALLQHLKSHSLTIVSSAWGALEPLGSGAQGPGGIMGLGARGHARNLIHSRHKMRSYLRSWASSCQGTTALTTLALGGTQEGRGCSAGRRNTTRSTCHSSTVESKNGDGSKKAQGRAAYPRRCCCSAQRPSIATTSNSVMTP
ncbi:adenomatous polyposis coli protein isoform X2 [Lates japonicus]|uniref:Adenomatous polyposis coli protein isoform X2 n=1 Tax=Lates japonicus TaxID=270547 RepID=A0AAD3MN90_LATJO|nr:adenomatous polyposis coli protein isoform X2 [Lates japonicus]